MKLRDVIHSESFAKARQPIGMRYIVRPLSWIFAWAVINCGASANLVTLCRLLITVLIFIGMIAWPDQLNILIVLFLLIGVLGTAVDGCVSRAKNESSYFGKYFDGFVDSITEVTFYTVLAISLSYLEDDNGLILFGTIGSLSLHVFQSGGVRHHNIEHLMVLDGHKKIELISGSFFKWIWKFVGQDAPVHLWDIRYGGLIVSLYLESLVIYLIIICLLQMVHALGFVPLRLLVSYRLINKYKLSASASSVLRDN